MIRTKTRGHRQLVVLLTAVFLLTALSWQGRAQKLLSKESYMAAPPAIAAILHDENSYNRVSLNNACPDGEHFLIPVSGGLTSLEVMSRPYVNLAETAIDHHANRTRRLTIGNTLAYDIFSVKTKMQIRIESPRGATVGSASWSPDGKSLAFMVHRRMGSYLFVADVKSGTARQLSDTALLATLTNTLRWTWDSKKILTVVIPKDRGPRPAPDAVSRQPRILVNEQGKTPTRTYRFLLKTPHDAKFLEYLSRGQLALVDVTSGELEAIGRPAMFTSIDVSPDSGYFRVTTMQKPFSYIVPRRRFGTREELWEAGSAWGGSG